ncbi:MAG TPA: phospholipase D-like domain-containing protein [Rhodopila sp.]|nr:phospholipase D-like domain-containing protein [Rhodopila sp.]
MSKSGGIGRRRVAALATASLLSGCASVPMVDGVTARLIGLREPPARPKPPHPEDDQDALQQQYNLQRALSASPIVFGNAISLLNGGEAAFRAMFQAIRAARDSLNMEYFIFDDVVCDGVSLQDVLLDRLVAGVRVNISYDAFGSRGTPDAFFDTLRKAGAKVNTFNPLDPLAAKAGWSPNDRDHRKIMVVDGRIGFTGGVNLDKVYENPPSAGVPDGDSSRAYWRDVAVRIEGPAVAELQKLFFGTWREQKAPAADPATYFPPLSRKGVQTVRIIGSSPGQRQPLYYASLMAAVKSARRRIWLSSGYFVPPHDERKQLAAAARRGIDVRIVAPAFSDVESAVYAARASYGDLLEAGVHIYEMHDAVLHSKLAVVDDTWTAVGSSNLDRRSVVFNNEVDAIILGHDTAGQVEAVLQQYMAAARPVLLSKWRHRSVGERINELEARVWQYWM